jgi:hypothetical protein
MGVPPWPKAGQAFTVSLGHMYCKVFVGVDDEPKCLDYVGPNGEEMRLRVGWWGGGDVVCPGLVDGPLGVYYYWATTERVANLADTSTASSLALHYCCISPLCDYLSCTLQ